jgi:hypothetical protein
MQPAIDSIVILIIFVILAFLASDGLGRDFLDTPYYNQRDLAIMANYYQQDDAFAKEITDAKKTNRQLSKAVSILYHPDARPKKNVVYVMSTGRQWGGRKWAYHDIDRERIDWSIPNKGCNDLIKILAKYPLLISRLNRNETPPGEPQPVQEIVFTWNESHDPESGVKNYILYENDTPIAWPKKNRYVLDVRNYHKKYTVSAVNGEGLEGDRSPANIKTYYLVNRVR